MRYLHYLPLPGQGYAHVSVFILYGTHPHPRKRCHTHCHLPNLIVLDTLLAAREACSLAHVPLILWNSFRAESFFPGRARKAQNNVVWAPDVPHAVLYHLFPARARVPDPPFIQ